MKDSGEYKLIPVWNFFGRGNSNSDMKDTDEKCYVTINALDGTINKGGKERLGTLCAEPLFFFVFDRFPFSCKSSLAKSADLYFPLSFSI